MNDVTGMPYADPLPGQMLGVSLSASLFLILGLLQLYVGWRQPEAPFRIRSLTFGTLFVSLAAKLVLDLAMVWSPALSMVALITRIGSFGVLVGAVVIVWQQRNIMASWRSEEQLIAVNVGLRTMLESALERLKSTATTTEDTAGLRSILDEIRAALQADDGVDE